MKMLKTVPMRRFTSNIQQLSGVLHQAGIFIKSHRVRALLTVAAYPYMLHGDSDDILSVLLLLRRAQE